MYSRPFRVLQFDTVSCKPAMSAEEASKRPGAKHVPPRKHDYNYILTVICCFSRYVWLIPLKTRSAEEIVQALLEKCLLDLAMFPVVLRSDRATEFIGTVIAYINSQLEIRHVLGLSLIHI